MNDIIRISGYGVRVFNDETLDSINLGYTSIDDYEYKGFNCEILLSADYDFCYIEDSDFKYHAYIHNNHLYVIKFSITNILFNNVNQIDYLSLKKYEIVNSQVLNNHSLIGLNKYFYFGGIALFLPMINIEYTNNSDPFKNRYKKHDS